MKGRAFGKQVGSQHPNGNDRPQLGECLSALELGSINIAFHLSVCRAVCHQSSATCPSRTPHSWPKPESIATLFAIGSDGTQNPTIQHDGVVGQRKFPVLCHPTFSININSRLHRLYFIIFFANPAFARITYTLGYSYY